VNTENSNIRVIVSGGGTGGHIFPAVSIANALKTVDPNIDILFVGALGRMEMEKVPAAGYKIIGLPIAGFQRKLTLKNFNVIIKLFKSLFKAKQIVKEFNPHAVVGVGGYASGPMLWMAAQKGIPTVIQEQNSYAGVTNKLLAKKATKIFVAYEGMDKYFPAGKITLAGNPVRQGLENVHTKRDEAYSYFNLDPQVKTILCIGGSLGARTLNQSIYSELDTIAASNAQIIWQCGAYYFNEAKEMLSKYQGNNIKLYDFISRMDLAYAVADVVISRAGASSISELCIVEKPAILVPSPNVAEDHQTKNAEALASKQAAIMITDKNAKSTLVKEALILVNDTERCIALSTNIAKLALRNSAQVIANEIFKLIKTNN
jgi:UDP-N-acetylglucosamine--N-acetylmuramyl-(pentapeptide) pyrophosphoryl-undecaprenol N-acetylglucosamine transferase